jgi:ribosomal protein L2
MQKSMKESNNRRARLMENLQSLGRTGQETQTRMEEWKRQASRQHRPVETWRHSGMLHRMESQMGDIMRSEAKVRSKLNEVRHRLHQTSTSLMHRYGERGR